MAMFLVVLTVGMIVEEAKCQCYIDSDISIYQSGYPSGQYQESNNQCLANYTVISASIIDGSVSKGITCSRKDSTAQGTWTFNGTEIDCSNNTGPVRCTRQQPGSVTLFTAGPYSNGGDEAVPEGTYTCYIEGLCTSIRLWQYNTIATTYSYNNRWDSKLEHCTIIPPSDITAIPQQYMVQMVTSVSPPSRLASFIECDGSCGDGVTLGESYYTLVNLTAERYQFTVPVTWSANSISNIEHRYNCKIRSGGLSEKGNGDFNRWRQKNIKISSPSAPSSVSHEVVKATAISISWTITGNVNGFVISIISSGLDTYKKKLTDGSLRKFLITGLSSGRDYTIEVRGYNELLGPAGTTTVRLKVPTITFDSLPINTTSIMISWSVPENVIIDSCIVTVTRLCDSRDLPPITVNGKVQSLLIPELSSGLQYTVSVVPVNVLGRGMEKTNTVTVHDNGPPSGAPFLHTPVIVSSTTVILSWERVNCTEHNGVITGYSVQYKGKVNSSIFVTDNDVTSTVITGLINFEVYYISVAAINNNGIGPYSHQEQIYTIDTKLTGLSAIPSKQSVLLSWQPLVNVTNVTYQYEVAYAVDPECSGDHVSLPDGYSLYSPRTSSNSIEVLGLMSGTCYVIGVRAYTSVSDSHGLFSVVNNGKAVSQKVEMSTANASKSNNVLLVALIVMVIIVLILLMVVIFLITTLQWSRSTRYFKLQKDKTAFETGDMKTEDIYDTPNFANIADDIQVQKCEPYELQHTYLTASNPQTIETEYF